MILKTERRTQLRKRPQSLVYVELPPANGGMMRDLSELGFSLRAMMPLRPSEKIPFSFALDTSARIDGEAIVLRVDDGGHVAALEFAGLPSHSRDQIRRWLDKFDEPISPDPEPDQSSTSKHSSLTELRSRIRAPRPPSSGSPAAESAPPPSSQQKMTAPPRPESPPMPLSPVAEITPPVPPPNTGASPTTEAPPAPVSQAAEIVPTPSAVIAAPAEQEPLPPSSISEPPPPQPLQTAMALPKPAPARVQEASAPPPTVSHPALEQPENPPLPPLLKLSSVRPGPLPAETFEEPVVSVAIPKPVAEPPAKIQISLPKPAPPVVAESQVPEPAPAPPVAPRRLIPPPLEPLSKFEGDTDSETPGWMDSFTFGRAIGIMLFLTLLAGSYVYHRELGQALIWLGHQIAGDEAQESSKAARPEIPFASHATLEATPTPRVAEPAAPIGQKSPDTSEPKSANLPAASITTPSPQLKNETPGSLVPLTQVTRAPAPAPPTDNSVEAGQPEYLEALQILRSPSRASEVPAAIQLLWVAVEKGNTGAEIDLAELFRTGRGVTKNCDQTRILLSAAARKGSVEARKRLEALRREGCGN